MNNPAMLDVDEALNYLKSNLSEFSLQIIASVAVFFQICIKILSEQLENKTL